MYTLAQIAHFDRCLFPDDFRTELERVGIDEMTVRMVAGYIKAERWKHRNVGISQLYQEFINDEDLTKAFDTVLCDFLANIETVNEH